jgi:cytochrome c oxidase subunit 2
LWTLGRALTFSIPGIVLGSLTAAAEGRGTGQLVNPTDQWNHLFQHVLIDITIIGVVFGVAAAVMLWKYRARDPNTIGRGPRLTTAQAVGMAAIPAVVFMADDFFIAANGWALFNLQRSVPAGALEVKVTGSQFYWEFDYGNGLTTTNEMKVPVGKPVVLRLSSTDVIHSFFIPDFRIKEDAVPGRKTYLWFVAPKVGTTLATCAEFCGVGHPVMPANIEAVPPAEFEAWLASKGKVASSAQTPRG